MGSCSPDDGTFCSESVTPWDIIHGIPWALFLRLYPAFKISRSFLAREASERGILGWGLAPSWVCLEWREPSGRAQRSGPHQKFFWELGLKWVILDEGRFPAVF